MEPEHGCLVRSVSVSNTSMLNVRPTRKPSQSHIELPPPSGQGNKQNPNFIKGRFFQFGAGDGYYEAFESLEMALERLRFAAAATNNGF